MMSWICRGEEEKKTKPNRILHVIKLFCHPYISQESLICKNRIILTRRPPFDYPLCPQRGEESDVTSMLVRL